MSDIYNLLNDMSTTMDVLIDSGIALKLLLIILVVLIFAYKCTKIHMLRECNKSLSEDGNSINDSVLSETENKNE